MVDFEVGPTFDSFMGLKLFLEDHIGRRVDLVTPDGLKLRLRPIVEHEAVDVAQFARLAPLAHGYFGFEVKVVWSTATTKLEALESAVRRLLA